MSYKNTIRRLQEFRNLLDTLENDFESEIEDLKEEIEKLKDNLLDKRIEISSLEREINELRENRKYYKTDTSDDEENTIDIHSLKIDDKKRFFIDLICPEKSYAITVEQLRKEFKRFLK